jgi:mRNA-degrading endonuclease toxin of MazEF toxin-antitoxin module
MIAILRRLINCGQPTAPTSFPSRAFAWGRTERAIYPGEALVEVKGRRGRALGDQIRSIDKKRLKARAGRLTAEEMSRIDEAVAITLDLPVPAT